MTNTFPIRSLPLVALKIVFLQLEIRDIFLFSLISKRARFLLKRIFPKHHFKLFASMYIEHCFSLSTPRQFLEFKRSEDNNVERRGAVGKTHTMRNGLFSVNFLPAQNTMRICFSDFVPAICYLLTCIAEAFNFPEVTFQFGRSLPPNDAMKVMKFMRNLEISINRVRFASNETTEEAYTCFLESFQKIKILELWAEAPPGFQFSPESPDDFTLDEFHVSDGHWVKIEEYLKCKYVEVSNMTSQKSLHAVNEKNLNEFFKRWMEDGVKLEKLHVAVHPKILDFEKVTEGLGGTIETHEHHKCLKFTAKDGREAIIISTPMHLVMKTVDNAECDKRE